jgi:hypothetical protein
MDMIEDKFKKIIARKARKLILLDTNERTIYLGKTAARRRSKNKKKDQRKCSITNAFIQGKKDS